MHSDKKKHLICKLEDLNESGCYGWDGIINDIAIQCFLILHHSKVYSYLNNCPHTGVSLDWLPNQFLDSKNEFIHGLCLHGPCVGDRLQIINNEIIKGKIYLIL